MTNYENLARIDFLPELRRASLGEKADIIQRFVQESCSPRAG